MLKFSTFAMQQRRKLRRKLNLSSKKATRIGDIPANVLKANTDIYLKDVTTLINDYLEKRVCPDDLI